LGELGSYRNWRFSNSGKSVNAEAVTRYFVSVFGKQ